MDIKGLNYKDRLEILKEIFDTTNIVLVGAYGASTTLVGRDVRFCLHETAGIFDKNGGTEYCRADFWQDDKQAAELIIINVDM